MHITDNISLNQLTDHYKKPIDVVLFAHGLIGTVRGKSANGLIIQGELLHVVAIIDNKTAGQKTSEICKGVKSKVPIYNNVDEALYHHQAKALVCLIEPHVKWLSEIKKAIEKRMDIINTSYTFLKKNEIILQLAKEHFIEIFDLRDVVNLKAFPNINILNRKAKVIYVTGTDCGLGKRTAAYALTQAARRAGLNAIMFATGHTGLMLGEKGVPVDGLLLEFSNGVVSEIVMKLDQKGYDIIFVEGQADIFHPAYSGGAISLLHGSNPDGIILVHDDTRKGHKGFEEGTALYRMHPVNQYIETIEKLSLPSGPVYKTIGIATIGNENINNISNKINNSVVVSDVLLENGAEILLNAVLDYCQINRQLHLVNN